MRRIVLPVLAWVGLVGLVLAAELPFEPRQIIDGRSGWDATSPSGCLPTEEIARNFTLRKAGGGDLLAQWQASTDPCLDGYAILGATSLGGPYSTEAQVGLVTSTVFTPGGSFFIVVGTSGGNTGPWGHFGL